MNNSGQLVAFYRDVNGALLLLGLGLNIITFEKVASNFCARSVYCRDDKHNHSANFLLNDLSIQHNICVLHNAIPAYISRFATPHFQIQQMANRFSCADNEPRPLGEVYCVLRTKDKRLDPDGSLMRIGLCARKLA